MNMTEPSLPQGHLRGASAARVVILEYGDFECPACAQAETVIRMLLERYPDDACARFRHFPLSEVHPHAELAAEAAEAAAAQGRFWDMADLLFKNQLELTREALSAYARMLGLDLGRFDDELDRHIYRQLVKDDMQAGKARGVRATPGLFLNERLIDASFGLQRLSDAVRDALG
jgi:protein-disulfide isomerase